MSGETWRRWSSGLCPCCGGDICEDTDGTAPEAIGEGVLICGRCVANDHLEPARLVAAMLEAILTRSEEPIERLLPGSWLQCEPPQDTGRRMEPPPAGTTPATVGSVAGLEASASASARGEGTDTGPRPRAGRPTGAHWPPE